MGMTIKMDPSVLSARIKNEADKAMHNAARTLRREAANVQRLVMDMMPIDQGTLESSVAVEFEKGERNRLEANIFIDPRTRDEHGRSVDVYAMYMHELLYPYGIPVFNLGKHSQEKNAETHKVGGKYMDRAVEERQEIIFQKMLGAVRDSLT